MSITYLPTKVVKKIAPQKLIKRLVTEDLTLNKAVLNVVSRADFLSKKSVQNVALKVIKQYKKSYKQELADGIPKGEALEDVLNQKKLMVNRVQNHVLFEIKEEIKDQYRGEFYEWLPSDAEEPSPEHQLLYGQTFQIGKGEMPGDRYGCRCGMHILVDERTLDL